eukprot:9063500-Pyramimonas_sp.AAC.1
MRTHVRQAPLSQAAPRFRFHDVSRQSFLSQAAVSSPAPCSRSKFASGDACAGARGAAPRP